MNIYEQIIAAGESVTLDETDLKSKNQNMHIILQAGARLTWLYRHSHALNEQFFHTFTLEHGAELNCFYELSGSTAITGQVHFILNGSHAKAWVRGMYKTVEDQNFIFKTHQEHRAPDTSSSVIYKGILYGTSRAVYEGIIEVQQGAQRTNAIQKNHNLLCDTRAAVYAEPKLEVRDHEVHCTHGSAIGFLDAEQLLYLQARGLPENTAKSLLIKGFFADILTTIDNDKTQQDIETKYVF